jgi:hypothetical protein
MLCAGSYYSNSNGTEKVSNGNNQNRWEKSLFDIEDQRYNRLASISPQDEISFSDGTVWETSNVIIH